MADETLDEILEGRLRLYQKKRGYRFSLDALLLAHFISFKKNHRVVELGCGCGIITLILAVRFPQAKFAGLEIQPDLYELSARNVRLNALEERVTIISGDARKIKKYFRGGIYDVVFFNPPYRKLKSGRINPREEKAVARHEIKGSLNIFLQAAKYLLKPKGKVFVIYPAQRLAELVARMRQYAMEPKRMKMVFSDMETPAEFVLMEAVRQGGEEMKIEPPLVIYRHNKSYTEQMKIIFQDLAGIPSGVGG